MMKCPYCQYTESKVIDSRPTDEGEKIRRRRECMRCGKRFTTYEIVETTPLMVVKKDHSIEPFNRDKLFNGLLRACEKRPVSLKSLEQIVDEIEQKLKNSLEGEVNSRRIGELAMEELRRLVWEDLDQAMILGLEMTVEELRERGAVVHQNTQGTLDDLRRKLR